MARRAVAVFDLDRTLITTSSATVFRAHLATAGLGGGHELPLVDVFTGFYERFGETWLLMQPARLSSRAASGWRTDVVAAAMRDAAEELETLLVPGARTAIAEQRAAGRGLVMATTSPRPFVEPFAERLGFDDVVATEWERRDGPDGEVFTGRMTGEFVWGRSKADAVRTWAEQHEVDLTASWAYSDSYFDAPLLAMVGHPVAVNPDLQLRLTAAIRGWPVRHFDRSDGVAKILGRELQEWGRPFVREEIITPNARVEISGLHHIPASGPAIVVFNHRSYFDPFVMALVIAKAGRNVRGLGKKEVFDVPLVGSLLRASGGIRVDRGTGSDEPLEAAIAAVEAGELLMIAPQGTIPRGPAFFDPELKGRWGAARIAAATRAPVIPVGLWGTEHVWPRNSRLPKFSLTDRPLVTAAVGPEVALKYRSPDADTKRIMAALVDVLPPEARLAHVPSDEELARTYPPGYTGDPTAEADRRPGTDTRVTKGSDERTT
jgi:putative phosphoserine phosphatase/1-acylglycerol-3-phosphate O-acyltransferase